MRVVILGAGRVGATLATRLSEEGHEVTIIDRDAASFRRLGPRYRGRKVVGWGIDPDTLAQAGVEGADAFIALTNGDNTNIMASQLARARFGAKRVLARIYDPIRAEAYHELGIETVFCFTYRPEFFKRFNFIDLEKMELPRKVWTDCFRCPRFPNCDESALIYYAGEGK